MANRDDPKPRDTSPLSAPENPPGVGTGPITTSNPTGKTDCTCTSDASPAAEDDSAALVAAHPAGETADDK